MIARASPGPRQLAQARGHLRARRHFGQQLLDLPFGLVHRAGEQSFGVVLAKVRRQLGDGAQMQTAIREHVEKQREAARGPRAGDAQVGLVLGQVQHLPAVAEHRSARFAEVELAGVDLYYGRWKIELGIGEVKTDLLDATHHPLRSTAPDRIRQELWGILLAYNLIRLEIERIAHEAQVAPIRISFVTAAHHISLALLGYVFTAPGAVPKRLRNLRQDLERFVLLPRRLGRSSPRAVKVKMSSYPKRRRPPAKIGSRKPAR